MKQRLFLILLALVLVFALAACAGSADVDEPGDLNALNELGDPEGKAVYDSIKDDIIRTPVFLYAPKSHEQLAAFAKANYEELSIEYRRLSDLINLKSLNHYYVPVYAESHYFLNMIRVEEGGVIPVYSSDEQKQDTFLLAVSRSTEYAEYELSRTINPNNYSTGIAPQPVEGVEGVYYKEIDNTISLGGEVAVGSKVTQFYWVHDGYYCFMKISQSLLNEIREKDPEALKGKLFELQKIELK